MEVRTKFIWRSLSLLIFCGGTFAIVQDFLQGKALSFRDWFFVLCLPLLLYAFVFVMPTMRITFSNLGISVYWKIGVGSFRIWEQTKYHLRWNEVASVFSQFPTWWLLHFIAVIGYQDGRKLRMFYLGALMTKKKESLVYIADHVGANMMGKNVLRLAEKYRQQLQKKSRIIV